jgi:hypothetical protein
MRTEAALFNETIHVLVGQISLTPRIMKIRSATIYSYSIGSLNFQDVFFLFSYGERGGLNDHIN